MFFLTSLTAIVASRRRYRATSNRDPRGDDTGSDRSQRANVAKQAKAVLQAETPEAVADRGYYFNGEEIFVMRTDRNDCDAAKANDVGREVGRPLREAGLRVSARRRRLSLPARRDVEVPLRQRGTRTEHASLLDKRLQDLRDQDQCTTGKERCITR